jgi:hypothetical protein
MSMVQQSIEVGAPLHTVYENLAAFENYPRFMTGVRRVTPVGPMRTHWVMDVDGERREFDAQITECSLDERVAWATTDGPRLAETLTLHKLGDSRTRVLAELEADAAFLMPGDQGGAESLTRMLKDDLTTFKGLVETGVMRPAGVALGSASTKQLAGRSGTIFGGGRIADPASPASVAARIKRRGPAGAADLARMGTNVDITSAPGIRSTHDLDDVLAPGRRVAGTSIGTANMGGVTPARDLWGDGMINEEDRGSAHDY